MCVRLCFCLLLFRCSSSSHAYCFAWLTFYLYRIAIVTQVQKLQYDISCFFKERQSFLILTDFCSLFTSLLERLLEMENTGTEQELGSSSTEVFKLPGEPAIVINGVPDISPSDGTLVLCNTVNDAELSGNTIFGEWLEGRTVQKLFGGQYYSGLVTEFDKDAGWYRVVYDDGDFEDLDWRELEEVLLPMDITVPLRSLALKTIRKNKKLVNKSGKNVGQSRNYQAKNLGSKGKKIAEHDEASLTKFNSSLQLWTGGGGTISKDDE